MNCRRDLELMLEYYDNEADIHRIDISPFSYQ